MWIEQILRICIAQSQLNGLGPCRLIFLIVIMETQTVCYYFPSAWVCLTLLGEKSLWWKVEPTLIFKFSFVKWRYEEVGFLLALISLTSIRHLEEYPVFSRTEKVVGSITAVTWPFHLCITTLTLWVWRPRSSSDSIPERQDVRPVSGNTGLVHLGCCN